MKREVIECDVCGKVKQEVNHWFVIRLEISALTLNKWPVAHMCPDAKHICGQECVQKFLSNWMGGK